MESSIITGHNCQQEITVIMQIVVFMYLYLINKANTDYIVLGTVPKFSLTPGQEALHVCRWCLKKYFPMIKSDTRRNQNLENAGDAFVKKADVRN